MIILYCITTFQQLWTLAALKSFGTRLMKYFYLFFKFKLSLELKKHFKVLQISVRTSTKGIAFHNLVRQFYFFMKQVHKVNREELLKAPPTCQQRSRSSSENVEKEINYLLYEHVDIKWVNKIHENFIIL